MANKDFEFITRAEKLDNEKTRKSLTYWQDVWRRLKHNKLSMAGLVGIILIVLFGVFGPMFTSFNYSDQEVDYRNMSNKLDVIELEDNFYVTITPDWRIIELTPDGVLIENIEYINKDNINKIYTYSNDLRMFLDPTNNMASGYPLNVVITNGSVYNEKWGIALKEVADGYGFADAVIVTYIAPDSPFMTVYSNEYEGNLDDLMNSNDFVYFQDIRFSYQVLTEDPNDGFYATRPEYVEFTYEDGVEEIVAGLDLYDTIEQFSVGEDLIVIDFYNNVYPDTMQDGDHKVTITYRDNVNYKEVIDTVHNKLYMWGTDNLGRDILTRVMYGARISLIVALVATMVNFLIGITFGSIAGYMGGRVDNYMMRFVDIINSIPLVLYVILLMVLLREVVWSVTIAGETHVLFRGSGGLGTIILALGSVYWVGMARLVRGQILGLKEQEFVLAARTIGVSNRKIITRHLVPNAMGPIIVSMTMMIPSAVFTEAFLSFIGLGVSAPQASWGTLANDALGSLTTYPYQLFYPSAAIAITMLAFNFVGDGLRDALDPRLRKG